MFWLIFTDKFRNRLRYMAQNSSGREARLLAAKFSLLPSAFAAVFALQCFPGYGYQVLDLVALVAVAIGAIAAYTMPSTFIKLLRFLVADPNQVILWRKSKRRSRDEG
jgi:hypothetical protein